VPGTSARLSQQKLGYQHWLSIGDLMAELKLTHGGVYQHFSNKEHLYTDALAFGIRDVQARLIGRTTETQIPTLRQVIQAYLSMEHCAGIAEGCPVAALSTEIARQSSSTRGAFDGALNLYTALPGALPLVETFHR
jgi:TetR/AcrR family transcriptional repressor of nem operon